MRKYKEIKKVSIAGSPLTQNLARNQTKQQESPGLCLSQKSFAMDLDSESLLFCERVCMK